MKELIQELAIKSGFKKYKNDDGLYSPYVEGESLNDELQEFAELIAKDCLIEVQRCTLRNGDTEHNRALSKAMLAISKKFGVHEW